MKIQKFTVPYAQVPNALLTDDRISWNAKAIWAYIQSKPESYDFSSVRMTKDSKDKVTATRSGLSELEKYGYLVRKRLQNGRMIYELKEKPELGNRIEGKPLGGEIAPISNKELIVIKKTTIAEASPAPWNLENALLKMEAKPNSHLDIIATFIREKPVRVESSAQLSAVISRFVRVAKKISEAYSQKQVYSAIDKIKEKNKADERKGNDTVDWTLETILKQLTK